jgi:hypothetical protein
VNSPNEHLFNFYLLAGDVSSPALYKVPLDRALQQELTVHFEALRASFRARGTEYVRYDPGYRPDLGELFRVPGFRLPSELSCLVASSPTLHPLDDDALESEQTRALVGVGLTERERRPIFSFQALDARQILRRDGWTLLLSTSVFRRIDHAGLMIRNALDAVFENGDLYFGSEYVARRFLDFTALFEEATESEVREFLRHPSFALRDEAGTIRLADQWVRRKIKMLTAGGVLDRVSTGRLSEHARRFQIDIRLENARIVIPAEKKELKLLLRLLDEDFLESALTNARFLVNSKRKLVQRS